MTAGALLRAAWVWGEEDKGGVADDGGSHQQEETGKEKVATVGLEKPGSCTPGESPGPHRPGSAQAPESNPECGGDRPGDTGKKKPGLQPPRRVNPQGTLLTSGKQGAAPRGREMQSPLLRGRLADASEDMETFLHTVLIVHG